MRNNMKDFSTLLWLVFKALIGRTKGTDQSLIGYPFASVLVATFVVSMVLFVSAIFILLGLIKLFYY